MTNTQSATTLIGIAMNNETIIPAPYTKYCPSCGGELEIQDIKSEVDSKCKNCSYSEPAANAYYMTFLSRSLSEYAYLHDIENVFAGDEEISIFTALEGNALLPAFVNRSEQIIQSVGLSRIKGLSSGLKIIQDENALGKQRVVIDPDNFSLGNSMIMLSETIHEAIMMTQAMSNEFYESQICIDYMPNLNSNIQIPDTPEGSLTRALQKASQSAPGI